MSELTDILQDSVNKVLHEKLTWDSLKSIEENAWSEDLWSELKDLGLPTLFLAEEQGGMNASWQDAYVVLRACGRFAVPIPIPEAIIANWYAREANIQLPDNCWSLVDEKSIDVSAKDVSFNDVGVPWGRLANYLLIIGDNNLRVAEVKNKSVKKQENIGRDPRDLITGEAKILEEASIDLCSNSLLYLGALQRSAQIAGAASMAFDLAVKYSGEREQFGRSLSKFQAIQHYLSDLAGLVASVDAISLAACNTLDSQGLRKNSHNSLKAIAAAKCQSSDSVEKISRLAHQVHGAIGFTYEYGLHYVTRRLWAWRSEFGSSNYWGEFLGDLALDAGENGVWPLITK